MGKFFWIVVIFLVIGGYLIKTAYDYDFGREGDTRSFIARFARWVWNVGENIVGLIGFAAEQEWLPSVNETNTSEG